MTYLLRDINVLPKIKLISNYLNIYLIQIDQVYIRNNIGTQLDNLENNYFSADQILVWNVFTTSYEMDLIHNNEVDHWSNKINRHGYFTQKSLQKDKNQICLSLIKITQRSQFFCNAGIIHLTHMEWSNGHIWQGIINGFTNLTRTRQYQWQNE